MKKSMLQMVKSVGDRCVVWGSKPFQVLSSLPAPTHAELPVIQWELGELSIMEDQAHVYHYFPMVFMYLN